MPVGTKAERLDRKAEKRAEKKLRKKEKKQGVMMKGWGKEVEPTPDPDEPADAGPADAELEKQLKKEERRQKKEKKRKREEDGDDDSAKASKKSKAHNDPIITPLTMPSAPDDQAASPTSEKKSKNSKKRKSSDDVSQEPEALETLKATGGKTKKDRMSKRAKKTAKDVPDVQNEAVASLGKALDELPNLQQDFIPLEDTALEKLQVPATNGEAKKNKLKKKSKNEKAAAAEAIDKAAEEVNGDEAAPQEDTTGGAAENASSGKKNRFVCFVGNLPFTATKEDIQKHFEKISPTDVRIMTDKDTKKPKGFAFVEFDRFDRMETCLKKYQHSQFGEGKKARKINVELTSGGGGNSEFRKSKIEAKNMKLHDERQREREKRDELEAKQQERKAKKESKQKGAAKETTNGAAGKDEPAEENNGIHPARLAMMSAKPAYGRTRF